MTPADGIYKFAGTETGLIPDAAFYSAERDATIPRADEDKPIPFAPDLAIEVASPSRSATDMAAKARLYLSGGTRLVWIVWPSTHHVDVWRRGHPSGPVRTLNAGDAMDGEDVIPGFTHPLADIFAGPLG